LKEPESRYPTAQQLGEALQRARHRGNPIPPVRKRPGLHPPPASPDSETDRRTQSTRSQNKAGLPQPETLVVEVNTPPQPMSSLEPGGQYPTMPVEPRDASNYKSPNEALFQAIPLNINLDPANRGIAMADPPTAHAIHQAQPAHNDGQAHTHTNTGDRSPQGYPSNTGDPTGVRDRGNDTDEDTTDAPPPNDNPSDDNATPQNHAHDPDNTRNPDSTHRSDSTPRPDSTRHHNDNTPNDKTPPPHEAHTEPTPNKGHETSFPPTVSDYPLVGRPELRIAPDASCRDDELEVLQTWSHQLHHTPGTAPRLVTCLGEPGAGKSRLLSRWRSWTMDQHAAPCVGQGVCSASTSHPLDPARDAIRELLQTAGRDATAQDISPLPDDDDDEANALMLAREFLAGANTRLASAMVRTSGAQPILSRLASPLFAGLGQVLTRLATTQPVVLVLDDVDQADFALLAFVEDVLVGLGEAPWPIAVLLAGRSDCLPEVPELTRLMERFREQTLDLPLERLSRERCDAFVDELLPAYDDLKAQIYHLSQGNPLFAVHILRHFHNTERLSWDGQRWGLSTPHRASPAGERSGEVPPDLLDLLLFRIDQAVERHASHPRLKLVLQWLSLLGQRTPIGLLNRAMGGNGQSSEELHIELELLSQEGLIRLDTRAGLVMFDHLLVREALLGEVNQLRSSRRLNQAAALAKLAYYQEQDQDPPLLEVAYHFRAAGDHDAYRTNLLQAAAQSAARLDRRRARAVYLDLLRELNDTTDPNGLARLVAWTSLGELCENLGELGPAEDYYRLAAQAAAQRGQTLDQARAMLGRARVLVLQNRLSEARPLSEAVINLTRLVGTRSELVEALITFTEIVDRIGDRRALVQAADELR
ncbi:MAG: AAA family ATPase, partial [Myxococcota bacterium]